MRLTAFPFFPCTHCQYKVAGDWGWARRPVQISEVPGTCGTTGNTIHSLVGRSGLSTSIYFCHITGSAALAGKFPATITRSHSSRHTPRVFNLVTRDFLRKELTLCNKSKSRNRSWKYFHGEKILSLPFNSFIFVKCSRLFLFLNLRTLHCKIHRHDISRQNGLSNKVPTFLDHD